MNEFTEFEWGPKSMPRPDEATAKKISSMVQRGELLQVLNHTKWAELRSEMLVAPADQSPRFRARSVFARPDFCSEWDGEFYYHVHPVAELEWMELKTTSQRWLRDALERHSIPYSLEAGVVRVWGYTRPGKQPAWQ